MKIHFVINLIIFIWYYKYLYFFYLSLVKVDILTRDTVLELHSFRTEGLRCRVLKLGSDQAISLCEISRCLTLMCHCFAARRTWMAIFLWIFSSKETETVPLLPCLDVQLSASLIISHMTSFKESMRDSASYRRQSILIEWGKCRAEPIIHAWATLPSSGKMNS